MQKDHQKQTLRLVRGVADRMRTLAGQALSAGYRFCYGTGVQTIRFMKYTGRRLKKLLAPVGRILYKAADFLLLRHLRALGREIRADWPGLRPGWTQTQGRLEAGIPPW